LIIFNKKTLIIRLNNFNHKGYACFLPVYHVIAHNTYYV
jgi:hypothetical protein